MIIIVYLDGLPSLFLKASNKIMLEKKTTTILLFVLFTKKSDCDRWGCVIFLLVIVVTPHHGVEVPRGQQTGSVARILHS